MYFTIISLELPYSYSDEGGNTYIMYSVLSVDVQPFGPWPLFRFHSLSVDVQPFGPWPLIRFLNLLHSQ
jgi:hypothetical protein